MDFGSHIRSTFIKLSIYFLCWSKKNIFITEIVWIVKLSLVTFLSFKCVEIVEVFFVIQFIFMGA